MNDAELKEMLPLMLEHRYPGQWREVLPGLAWELQRDEVPSVLSVHSGAVGDYVRVQSGAAIDVPLSGDLTLFVAGFNKELWNGRAYLQADPSGTVCFVALQDNFFGSTLSYDFQPSIDDFGMRLGTLTSWAQRLSEQIRERFGGTPLVGAQTGVLFS